MDNLKRELLNGLSANPPYIPAWYRYDEEGSRLNDICMEQCKYYYFHRFERNILIDIITELTEYLKDSRMVVDLGSGNATKTMLILDKLLETHESLTYVPVDISKVDDKLVITFDVTDASRKDIIELSYLDPEGYSEKFYLNSIHRLNREMNGNIDVSKFEIKNELVANSKSDNCSYVNVWIEAIENCEVNIGKLDLTRKILKGERLYLNEEGGISSKHTIAQFEYLLNKASLGMEKYWTNEHVGVVLVNRQ
ncbi:Hypothetical predicted protein [Mytilus galloprovincialis]|uniref:Histidine-specific methyltransferase SAM-dependent domain-containing protein n=1 Tax=Mytilus galloprovincialis TaxID=29158 RepID=A0A8B6ERX8_MYTGA|nr:Hypothetical predicted protein [Mytilus galloprovincialis]